MSDISLHNSLGQKRNKRNAQGQKDAGQPEQQRPRHAVESADKIPALSTVFTEFMLIAAISAPKIE